MANNNNQLPDTEIRIDAGQLSELTAQWNSDVLGADLSSLNISGTFSALTGQGVGAQYIESLENAIAKAEKYALNISKIISATAADQTAADQNAAQQSDNNNYNNYANQTGRRPSGGGGSHNKNDYSDKEKKEIEENDKDDDTKKQELTDEELITIVESFLDIFNGDLKDILFNEAFASKLKEQLLASPNISDKTKEVLSKMDPKTIQVFLQNMMLSGETATSLSKVVVTVFDKTLKSQENGDSIFEAAENISSVYSDLSKEENFQEELHKLYNASTSMEKADDNVILFTRDFVDTLAAASNATYEDVLLNPEYKETLLYEIKDLANTFTVLNEAKNRDSNVSSTLYKNIIVKEG